MNGAVRAALAELERLGATLVDVSLPRTELSIPVYYIIAPAEASSNLSRFDGVKFGVQSLRGINAEKDILSWNQSTYKIVRLHVQHRSAIRSIRVSSCNLTIDERRAIPPEQAGGLALRKALFGEVSDYPYRAIRFARDLLPTLCRFAPKLSI